jgi:hypothetical protein
LLVAFQRLQGTAAHNGGFIPRKFVNVQQLAQLQLNQLQQLFVVHHVHFVEEDDDGRHFYLAGQENVLTGLGHRAVRRGNHQNRAVHLGCAGDHVFDVVPVSRAVDMGIVPVFGLVLHMGDGNRDTTGFFFRGIVDLVEGGEVGQPFERQGFGDCRCQGGFAVVHVTNRANIHMWFFAHKFFFTHR